MLSFKCKKAGDWFIEYMKFSIHTASIDLTELCLAIEIDIEPRSRAILEYLKEMKITREGIELIKINVSLSHFTVYTFSIVFISHAIFVFHQTHQAIALSA